MIIYQVIMADGGLTVKETNEIYGWINYICVLHNILNKLIDIPKGIKKWIQKLRTLFDELRDQEINANISALPEIPKTDKPTSNYNFKCLLHPNVRNANMERDDNERRWSITKNGKKWNKHEIRHYKKYINFY